MIDRGKLLDELDTRLDRGDRFAFLDVKLSKLGDINAAYGYRLGDRYLEDVERAIEQATRDTDVVARIGDKQFGIILTGLKNPAVTVLAANKILTTLDSGVDLDGNIIYPDVAIGIVCAGDDDDDRFDLLTKVSIATDQAECTPCRYKVFQSIEEVELPTLVFENEIHKAFLNDEFQMHYQPQIDLRTGVMVGAEALIRWASPTLGNVNTQKFVNALEQSNHLLDVTKWVLNRAIRQCVECTSLDADFDIAVNISASLLSNPHVVGLASNAAGVWGKDPSSVTIEITESAMMDNPEICRSILESFAGVGFHISIDDFGTGYSSLEYLRDLPVSKMKIDRSFVMNMMNSTKDHNIVKAAIELAHALELEIVAEGIEDRETFDMLTDMGCDVGQGYYIARPMSFDDFCKWIDEGRWSGKSKLAG